MLYGEYKHSIDKKGRVSIPAKHRDELGDKFMICRGIFGKPCICAYSQKEWEKLVAKIGELPVAKSSQVKRFLYSGAFEVEYDAQGRILIPASLRDYAELTDVAHIIGMDTNLEIWNGDNWEAENAEYTPESIAEIVLGLDL